MTQRLDELRRYTCIFGPELEVYRGLGHGSGYASRVGFDGGFAVDSVFGDIAIVPCDGLSVLTESGCHGVAKSPHAEPLSPAM